MPTYLSTHQSAARGRTAQFDGFELYYEEFGAGEPLLLLHGFGGCVQNWYPFLDALSARYRLILVDLRGHGFSTMPSARFTHRDAAADVFALLDRLGVCQFAAMGMSTGGMVLLHMATSQPGRIRAMVLISATTHFPHQARAIMRRASVRTMPPPVLEMYRTCAKRGDEQVQQLIAHFNALGDDDSDMQFTTERLAAISAPTLVVHGDRDAFFPEEIAVELSHAIPDATLWIISNGEHVPIFDTAVPFSATALRFLDESTHR